MHSAVPGHFCCLIVMLILLIIKPIILIVIFILAGRPWADILLSFSEVVYVRPPAHYGKCAPGRPYPHSLSISFEIQFKTLDLVGSNTLTNCQ